MCKQCKEIMKKVDEFISNAHFDLGYCRGRVDSLDRHYNDLLLEIEELKQPQITMEKINQHWVDENNNQWDMRLFSEQEAAAASKTLENCTDCINCIKCSDCHDCLDCFNCIRCDDCISCNLCMDCMTCVLCHIAWDLYNCQSCNRICFLVDCSNEIGTAYLSSYLRVMEVKKHENENQN